jgi:hypothetical protein
MKVRRMAASVAAAVMVAGIGLAAAPAASAATDEFQVQISNTDASWDRWDSTGCDTSLYGDPFYYQVFTLTVSASGDYDYYDVGYLDHNEADPPYVDMEIGIYNLGAFDPSAPGDGCVFTADDTGTASLDAGQYTLVVTTNNSAETGLADWTLTGPGTTSIVGGTSDDGKNLAVWHQSVGRGSASDACPDGYAASWEQWPNGGVGGWVCYKDVYVYYPDEPVK